MKKITVLVETPGQFERGLCRNPWDGWESDTPGLAIVHWFLGARDWIVVHKPSGKSITPFEVKFKTRALANQYAIKAGEMVNWTKGVREIREVMREESKISALRDNAREIAGVHRWE